MGTHKARERATSVFVNCPFDKDYAAIHDALVFAISACGYTVRSGLEVVDSGELRLQKILRLLAQSRFSIHDLSRIELDPDTALPRFNMPLELGIALGMKHLGNVKVRDHALLILDSEPYRYVKFASDLAGVDIGAHGNTPERAIRMVRDYLATSGSALPDGDAILSLYDIFEATLPTMALAARQAVETLTFVDRLRHIEAFLATLVPE